jgi:cbb3-type cytochrome oxidase subunit 3
MKKLAQYPRLIFLLVFLITYTVSYFSKLNNPLLSTLFSITLAFILSPRKKKIETQSQNKTQITWLFLKEPIIIE